MKLQVLAFGIAKEIFGTSALTIDIAEQASAYDLKLVLESNYPRLKQLASYLLAVNSAYADNDLVLTATDEIAIIPPVSGG